MVVFLFDGFRQIFRSLLDLKTGVISADQEGGLVVWSVVYMYVWLLAGDSILSRLLGEIRLSAKVRRSPLRMPAFPTERLLSLCGGLHAESIDAASPPVADS